MASPASGSEPVIDPGIDRKDTAGKPPSEAVDPMIPHSRRDQVSGVSKAPKENDQTDVIDPMIPHNSRREME